MPAPQSAPAWAAELALAYESRASSQFILFGNVHDRIAVGDELVSLADYLENTLLKPFSVVLTYDLGNGLSIERGGEVVEKWQGAELRRQVREPQPAFKWVGRYLRYLGNLRALGNKDKTPNVAVIVRGVDQIIPADGAGFEHGSITSHAARLVGRVAVRRAAVHQPPDRRQPQRRRAADRKRRAERAHPRAAAGRRRARARAHDPRAARRRRPSRRARTSPSSPAASPASPSRASKAW